MLREEQTEVLVVGAGPVGMLTALLLAKGGVSIRIIDQEWRTASRNYACALHPSTLKLLDRLGLGRDILAAGHQVGTVALYEGAARRAEAKLSRLAGDFPFVLVLSQSSFESLLEERLKLEASVSVEWNHKLSGLRPDAQGMVATVDQLGVSAKGYIVPEMEWSVEKTHQLRAGYVVGADGPKSFVAESLAAGSDIAGESEFFAVYEFASDWEAGDESRVVLDQGTTSVLWPLPGNRFRWSFQLRQEHLSEFPAKDRQSLRINEPGSEAADRGFVQKLIKERAPWFTGGIGELDWSTDVEFEHRVAKRFGRGYCWLAGDAAHQTGPAGMQSLNRGILEADQLTSALIGILREKASTAVLENYNKTCGDAWRQLLGLGQPLKSGPSTDAWIRERSTRIPACIPASGDDLKQLLNQLQLDWA